MNDRQQDRPVAAPRLPGRPPRRLNRLRSIRYWPLAVAEVVIAIVLGLTLPDIEAGLRLRDWLDYDASTAQTTLAAIAGGMITLTGFVLTAVTLMVQTVQGQSSRLLQALNRTDRTPLLFGTFAATFTYALLVLSVVHGDDVPGISVTVALLMVLVCTAMFLRLLVTFRTTLTVVGLTTMIGHDLRELVDVMYPAAFGSADCDLPAQDLPAQDLPAPRTQPTQPKQPKQPEEPPAWTVRHAGEPGVFQSFNELRSVRTAGKFGATIRFVPAVGDFVVTGAVLATGTGERTCVRAVRGLVRVGAVRTLEQDPAYGLRMLVDIAIRALSPAVNDPTSAIQALDQIDDVLTRLAGRSLGDGRLHDESGRVVVSYPAPTWDAFLSLGIDEILLYGSGSLQITRRLRALLDDLRAVTPPARWPAIDVKLAALRRAVRRAFPDKDDEAEATRPDRQGIGSPRR
ncbi:MAG TPA: DUF2254 domain-containing protein [Streptosporangiaceae bacterium]